MTNDFSTELILEFLQMKLNRLALLYNYLFMPKCNSQEPNTYEKRLMYNSGVTNFGPLLSFAVGIFSG